MPDWSAYVRRHLSLPALRREREAEIVEDLARQLDDAYRDALAGGATKDAARARAEQHIDDWHDLSRRLAASTNDRLPAADRWQQRADDRTIAARGRFTLLANLRQDLIYAARTLRRHRGVSLVAVLSLALGIGANTAIFTVINALMFRSLPVSRPQSLVSISDPASAGMQTGIEDGERTLFSYREFEGLRDRNDAFSATLAFSSLALTAPVATGDDEGRPASISMVSGTFFPALGVEPLAGRAFGAEVDAVRMANPVALVSHAFWTVRMQQSPQAIGRTIRINSTAFSVIGVLPASFTGLMVGEAPDVFVPLTMQAAVAPGRDWLTQPPASAGRTMFLHIVGRLKPGVSLAQADASINLTFHQNLEAEAALIADADRRQELLNAHVVVRDARHGLSPLRDQYQAPLLVLMALVGLLLLLACANVANLLLARAASRRRELAMRVALGAGRGRIVRQLMTESLLLATLGATAGTWIGMLGVSGLLRLVAADSAPIALDARLDATVLAFTIGMTLITGVLFGLAPAIRATTLDLNVVLRGAAANVAGSGRGTGRWPLGKTLAASQVAISLLLLVTSGLFIRSLQNLASVPLGYEPGHLLLFRLDPRPAGYTVTTVRPLYQELLAKFASLPNVRGATLSDNGLFYDSDSGDNVSFPGYAVAPGLDMGARFDGVGPGYFGTVGIPVTLGRDVEAQDSTGARHCWLAETMSRHFFQKDNPIGRQMVIHYSFGDDQCEISGVVADARPNSLRGEIKPRFYQPFFGAKTKPVGAVFELRVEGDPNAIRADVRRVLHETNAAFTPPAFHTVPELIDLGLAGDRLTARLSTLFGVLALVLAAIGLYGVLSYSVSRRVSEIGVRMALGADRGRILGLVIGEALLIASVGAAAGLAAALGVTRFLGTLLFGLNARDPLTLTVGVAVLLTVALFAAAVPAWRASRIDPIRALRSE